MYQYQRNEQGIEQNLLRSDVEHRPNVMMYIPGVVDEAGEYSQPYSRRWAHVDLDGYPMPDGRSGDA